ncbi:competence protein ComEC family protein [Sulfitobacter sp. S223]|uniref:ComEC/Rec2 family competence protein n=1 Tax=Sulfitobacter sp. S223 TaxID=2867023 RepID=UPI0021A7BF4C|nr:ComEC/Rec2 family competence protein [Sulfitobacter sp. S223]UWR27739.1 competence protein ComEC family protein [Sulfitobacter sp. S223]
MGAASVFAETMRAQRGALFGWVPVCLAFGIGGYFSLGFEPSFVQLATVALLGLVCAMCARLLPEPVQPFAVAGMLVCAGVLLAAGRAHSVAGPVLEFRYYGAVEGRIIAIDRSQSDALRLTLDNVVLDRVPPARTPQRVRLSLHGDRSADIAAEPGLRVMVTGHLSPPSGPVEPGGFDFQRHAWFVRLGAVGYARTPLMGVAEPQGGLGVFKLRMAASARIQAVLGGDVGGFAAAITTGDRSAISQAALDALRASNLAHLLAISGLHMGLMSGVVFAALRLAFALVPPVALRMPARSIAAGGALIAAAGYLALSGGNVATQRAFIMVGVALFALMIGRRAISLRGVAIAATIVLVLRPEALMGPGFQMSFAATTALVAVFGWMRDGQIPLGPRWLQPVLAVVVSSAVAGFATAPIAAAHFNAIAQYGLLANLASVPLMGVLVIPAAVVAVVLAPFGLEAVGLWAMSLGVRWILSVAHFVADLPQARTYVVGPGGWVLPLLALGFLTLLLWRGRLRWGGAVAMVASFVVWSGAERPAVLVSDTGTLVGVMTSDGRALSKERGAGFVARNWLENDGDGQDQATAAGRWQQGGLFIHVSGKRAAAEFKGCKPDQIVISSVLLEQTNLPCVLHDPESLRHTGAVAYFLGEQGAMTLKTARAASGERLWTRWPKETPRAEYLARRKDD